MTKIFLSLRYKYDGKSVITLTEKQAKTKDKIISAFKKGILKWEENKCRCSSNDDLIISMKERYGFKVRFVLCKNCGLIRTDPRISEDSIGIFYEKYYRNLVSSIPDEINEVDFLSYNFNMEMNQGKRILEYIKKNTSLKNGVVFDFGTGSGGMLKVFNNAGFETFGVDVSEDFLKYGLNEGLNLKKGSVDELKNYPIKASLIIASHIVEHLHRLDEYLRDLWDCLENKGYLYIELPGLFMVQNHFGNLLVFFLIEHLYYFTLQTLRKILADNGFQLVIGNEEIVALFQKIHQKNKIKISKEYINNILIYLRIVDIPLPFNACNLIKNKKKLKTKFIISLVSIIYKTKIVNLLALLRIFLKKSLKKVGNVNHESIYKKIFKRNF